MHIKGASSDADEYRTCISRFDNTRENDRDNRLQLKASCPSFLVSAFFLQSFFPGDIKGEFQSFRSPWISFFPTSRSHTTIPTSVFTMDGSGGSSPPLQICLSASKKDGTLVSAADASYEDRKCAAEAFHSTISQYTEGDTHLPYDLRFLSPHPILITDQFLANLRQFHEALAIALSNIVQRWFTDKEADFPTRMPIKPHEEEVLQVTITHIMYKYYFSVCLHPITLPVAICLL